MLKSFFHVLRNPVATATKEFCPDLAANVRGLPRVSNSLCAAPECGICKDACPTEAITADESADSKVSIDLGSCISCGLCTNDCPTGAITNNTNTKTARRERSLLIETGDDKESVARPQPKSNMFSKSLAVRVVSTGCSACDLEVAACCNPIFDMERFGIQVVASPRFADVLLVTGPVPKAMHEPLRRCYAAMAAPRMVLAVGTCAISGGVHKNGYAEANGVDAIIPVDAYVPGCPPHPWSIIDGLVLLMS